MYNKEILEKINKLASLFFTIDEIATYLKLDIVQLKRDIRNRNLEVSDIYFKGKMEQIIELRETTIEFAKKGSNYADQITKELINNQKKDE